MVWRFSFLVLFLVTALACTGCASDEPADPVLMRNTVCHMVDWHPTSAFGVIKCPVAWIRITNHNTQPIKHIKVEYHTYDIQNQDLDHGIYELEGEVAPGEVRNFTEQYLGLVSTHTEKLSITMVSVERGS
jgi:hypothetical protein